MKKGLGILLSGLAFITAGCTNGADTADRVNEVSGEVLSVQNDGAVIKIRESDGNYDDISLLDSQNITVLKNNEIIVPSCLVENDQIIVTYKDGRLQVIQVIADQK